MGRACGEPDEIELTAMGVELNGLGRVRRLPREEGEVRGDARVVPDPGKER